MGHKKNSKRNYEQNTHFYQQSNWMNRGGIEKYSNLIQYYIAISFNENQTC